MALSVQGLGELWICGVQDSEIWGSVVFRVWGVGVRVLGFMVWGFALQRRGGL